MNSDQSLICISKPAIAQRNRIDMNARARVASGDGEPSLKVEGIESTSKGTEDIFSKICI